MIGFKRNIFFLAMFTAQCLHAGSMGPSCIPENATIPCQRSDWEFGGHALYIQPNLSGIDFLGMIFNTPSLTGDASSLLYQKTGFRWGWGFQIEGAYHFSTGNDLNLNWHHFEQSTYHSLQIPAGSLLADNVNNNYNGTINTKWTPTWDQINIEFGQHVNFGAKDFLRVHGGMQFSRINTKASYTSSGTFTSSATEDMTYNGFGPRVGLDLSYQLAYMLNIYAKGATSLLIGPNQFSDTGIGPIVSTWGFQGGSSIALVPELEVKLGGQYSVNIYQGALTLDAGWMWLNYFNAQQNSAGNLNAYSIQQSDFGLQGLYFGLKYII